MTEFEAAHTAHPRFASSAPRRRWRDRGLRQALRHLRTSIRPDFRIVDVPPGITAEWDVRITMPDGAVLGANVFRPADGKPAPVIMAAHPYGKDRIPAKTRSGYGRHLQSRFLPQPRTVTVSQWTAWESPDPAVWVPQGFVVINADLRGGGTSDGPGELFSDQEALDYAELIRWAGTQPWSSGRVALDGVGYLAIAQYRVAALRPPNLAAIVPWEGFSDLYRDFARPGGVREDGFSVLWSRLTNRSARMRSSMRDGIVAHPELDDWYRARTPDLSRIEVPMLVCASFSDSNLHTRGSFEAFRRAGSKERWLYTHRDGKWSGYYAPAALEARRRFYNYTLKGQDDGITTEPRVRLAITESGSEPAEVTSEQNWPPADLRWRRLWLDSRSGTIGEQGRPAAASATFRTHGNGVFFAWTVPDDLDVIGPMALELFVDVRDADDVSLFVGARKVHANVEVTFEGSYGFGSDMMSKGWLRAAHRELDPLLSTPERPVHRHDRALPLREGEIASLRIALREHATRFRKGEQMQLELRGTWLYPGGVFGQFPAGYQAGPRALCTVHTGGEHASALLLGTRSYRHQPL